GKDSSASLRTTGSTTLVKTAPPGDMKTSRPVKSAPPSDKSAPPGDMTIKQYVLQKPAGPTALRINCEMTTYYNFAYDISAATHYSFRITDDSELVGVHAFAPKDSAHGRRLYDLLKDGQTIRVTVRVQRLGPSGDALPVEDDRCFALVGIVDAK